MKYKKYHNVGSLTKSNIKTVERGKPLKHKYMTVHFPVLE